MSQVKQVKDSVNIVDVIGERLELSRSGTNLKAVCPFHSEKTPSFFVSEVLQRYKCFGCGESGDVISFLEKYEGMSFKEALQYLAERVGIILTEFRHSPEDEQRERIISLLDLAMEYYHYLLTHHQSGKGAREYLKKRGITKESIKVFQLGYSLSSWDGLISFLHKKKKYSLKDIQAAGLIIQSRGSRYYDRFRNRIIFPLTNHRGQIVGFSGRTLDAKAKEAKYINTPETLVYHKSELLYGFSHLYQPIRQAEEVIIAEGEMDVISSAQAHVNNIVAIKGSALTREQMQLLRRVVQRVLLSFDMDQAGVEATKRAVTLAKEFNVELRVVKMPQDSGKSAKDPDELARSDPKAWRTVVSNSVSVYEFFLQQAIAQFDQTKPEGKRKIIDELAPIFTQITHEVEKDYYVKKLAAILQVSDSVVKKDFASYIDRKKIGSKKRSVSATKKKKQNSDQQLTKDRRHKLEEYLLFLLFRYTECKDSTKKNESIITISQNLKQITFVTPGLKQILYRIEEWQGEFTLDRFVSSLPSDLQQLVSDCYLHPTYLSLLGKLNWDKEWSQTRQDLLHLSVENEIQQITKRLDELDEKRSKTPQDEAEQTKLLQHIVELKHALKGHSP